VRPSNTCLGAFFCLYLLNAAIDQGHISPLFQPVIKKMLKNFLSEACITRRSDLPLRPLLKKGEVQT
jgi:hypothetical protein